ncbi:MULTISPECIES: hypothetical protein [Rhodovulum]|uniref:Tail assembly chaperone n=2 Tax=Rhodovulum TaxID=34008 RepID=A0A844BNU0_9RHOB|nr:MULTISPECIES: hypothetical protein [Rhodovulum]MRH22652.1 hypothetical protein [Rhodovulum strictum]TCM84780.1 hypothetical protein EV216_11098 [Rhodovulum steppense]
MKFRLSSTAPRYWWPVKVRIPDPDRPGAVVTQELKVQFEARTREATLAAQEEYAALTTDRDRAAHEHAELRGIVKNWDDVVDDEGGAVAFSDEAFEAALQHVWFRTALYRAFVESSAGEEARLGN